MFYLFLLLMWWALVATVFMVLSVPLVVVTSAVFLVLYVSAYMRASGRALGVLSPGQAVAVPAPSMTGPGEPAYVHYLSGPAGRDLKQVVRLSWEEMRLQARKRRDWLKAKFFGYGKNNYWRAIGVLFGAGLVVSSLITAAVMGLVIVGELAIWGLLFVLAKTVLYLLRGLDAGLSYLRGIKLSCPTCHNRVVYPAYECPGCGTRHHDVRPGKYGLLRRVCACGHRMPTLLLLGSHRMTAYCSNQVCGAPLAEGAGTAREIVVPMVGATTAGKTRMMLALAATLVDGHPMPGMHAEPADQETKRRLADLQESLRKKGGTDKTLAQDAMRGFSFNLNGGKVRRLVHIYDPPGERLNDSALLHELRFMRIADAFVFVVDPLAIPDVWDSLDAGAQSRYLPVRSARPPDFIFSQVVQSLEGMGVQPRKKALAVAVTKSDLTAGIPICGELGDGSDAVRGWLNERVGMGNMVRAITKAFGEVRYFHTTARFTGGDTDDNVRDLLMWTLGRYGVS
ncbi:TRAFAC clade GTPase domain-containing protein [Phytohabitans sp. LJ34]|uniref:TRAFAC clade GTPase domain-containing protein n=1 Tax=Phytohabitans sp. LJ34 TaxID=3452217 RepID=UPI003F8A53E2